MANNTTHPTEYQDEQRAREEAERARLANTADPNQRGYIGYDGANDYARPEQRDINERRGEGYGENYSQEGYGQPAYDNQLAADRAAQPVNQPMNETAARPMAEPVGQPVARPMAQPMAQPMAAQPMYATPAAGAMTGAVAGAGVDGTPMIDADDRVRWGPVWGGVLTTFALFLVLEFLGIGLGLISPVNGNGGVTSGISTLIAALIAFFIGGWIAESSSLARGFSGRLLTGFMVWALVTTLILAISFFGLGSLFGALGSVAGQASISTRAVSGSQVGNITQAAGWGAFIWLVISAILAMLGSLIGFPRRARIGNVTRRHRL